jgi:hypothetical protein
MPPTPPTLVADGLSGYCRASAHAKCTDNGAKGPQGQGRCECSCHAANAHARSRIEPSPYAKQGPNEQPHKPAPDKPKFRLIRKDPPRKLGLSDFLVPLLAEIPDDDDAWYSIAECPTSRGASVMATQCKKVGIPGWEWKAGETEVFVRRATRGGDRRVPAAPDVSGPGE